MTDTEQQPSKRGTYPVLALAAAVMAVYLASFISTGLGDLSGDSAKYLLLAKALARGDGFVEIEKPGAPPHTEYGPGLPALLAPVVFLAPDSTVAPKLVICACLIAAALLLYFLVISEGHDIRTAFMLLILLASMPALARFANQTLSDLPYAAASMLALLLISRKRHEEEFSARAWIVIGLVIGAAFLIRQVAAALLIGAVAGTLLDKSLAPRDRARAAALVTAGFALVAGAWLLRNYIVTGAVDPSHADKFFMARDADPFAGTIGMAGVLLRTWKGFFAYYRETSSLLLDMSSPLAPEAARRILPAFAVLPALLGLAARLIKKRGPIEIYFIVYLIIICAWQSHNPRYLIPIVPVAILFAAEGLRIMAGPFKRRGAVALFIIAVLFNLAVFIGDRAVIARAPVTPPLSAGEFGSMEDDLIHELAGAIEWGYWYQYPDWLNKKDPLAIGMSYHRSLAAAAWMGGALDESSLTLARKPRLVAYLSGRRVIQYPAEPDPARLEMKLRDSGVTHLFVDERSAGVRLYLEAFIRARPGALVPVFSVGDTVVYAVRGSG